MTRAAIVAIGFLVLFVGGARHGRGRL